MITHRQLVWREIPKFLEGRKGKVLDVGCQDNYFEAAFNQLGFEWFGVDLYPMKPNIVRADMCAMPFRDEEFDVVFSCHAFEHTTSPVHALKEMKRVLKKGGVLIIATPSPCYHQICAADEDHIFVLTPMQMARLFVWVGLFEQKVYLQTENIEKEQDFNVISVGWK